MTQVSRALNDHDDVNKDTKKRVQEAAKALNYQPNIMARRLVGGRSAIVGLIWEGGLDRAESVQFAQLVGGLSAHFSRIGRQFMLHVAEDEKAAMDVYNRLIGSRSIDGFVVISPLQEDLRVNYLRARKIPFVLHGQTMDTPDYPFYDIDNTAVGYDLTAHLIANGHRRIAFLNGPEKHSFVQRRFRGYAAAHAEVGLEMRPDFMVTGPMTAEMGLLETVRLFQSGGPAPTAMIAGSTLIAKGILDALAPLGLRIPGDVSIVAHDDRLASAPAESFPVALSGTFAPLGDAWGELAQLLDAALKGAPVTEVQRIGPHRFIAGRSVRRL